MSWEQFSEMFYSRYVPLVECERLAYGYLDLRQGTETVTKITEMFTERAIFCHEFVTSEQVQDGDHTVCFSLRFEAGVPEFVAQDGD